MRYRRGDVICQCKPDSGSRYARRLLGPLVGVAVLGLVLAWLSGSFEHKIEPGSVATSERMLPADAVTEVVHEVEKEYVEEAVGTLKAASRSRDLGQDLGDDPMRSTSRPVTASPKGTC